MTQAPSAVTAELLAIIESLPLRPTSGELLGALVRAERAGYERAQHEIAALEGARSPLVSSGLSVLLRRQAG